MMRLRINTNNLYPPFLAYYLQLDTSRAFFRKVAKRAVAQASINQDDIRALIVPFPPILEQKRIAEIISVWGMAVALMERSIAARQKRKQALTQALIGNAGKVISLSTFLTSTRYPTPKPNKPYTALGIKSHCKGTFQRLVGYPATVEMETLYEVKRAELIVNITFAWEGAIAIVESGDEGCLVSHRFPTFAINPEMAELDYVRYLVTKPHFVFQLGLISPGGAGRNRVLSKRDFLKLRVKLPALPEQRRRGTILQTADKEIALLEQRLDALRRQKKGLMQQLLTGKVPVKTPVEPPGD
jgi:type I restriction enzyme S subunit